MSLSLCTTGSGTTIVRALVAMLPHVRHDAWQMPRASAPWAERFWPPLDATHYVFAAGVLVGKRMSEQTGGELMATFHANTFGPIQACELILARNPRARICVIGSESAERGSHDGAYGLSKAALHRYVEQRRIEGRQQLVCLAPSVVWDSGMTQRRPPDDLRRVAELAATLPKGRHVEARDVARAVKFLLFDDPCGMISNCVIRLNGGAHAMRSPF